MYEFCAETNMCSQVRIQILGLTKKSFWNVFFDTSAHVVACPGLVSPRLVLSRLV